MGGNSLLREILARLARINPLAWAFILIILAFFLIQIPITFIKRLALAPLLIAILLIYQALWRGKMW